jgi:hypothetical protein
VAINEIEVARGTMRIDKRQAGSLTGCCKIRSVGCGKITAYRSILDITIQRESVTGNEERTRGLDPMGVVESILTSFIAKSGSNIDK